LRKSSVALLAVLALPLLAGCGSSSTNNNAESSSAETASATTASATTASASPSHVVVKTAKINGLGTVLVTGQGRTLYTFAPDEGNKVTCVGGCAAVWPPLKSEGTREAKALPEAFQSLVAALPDPEGGDVVAYHGWPLYTYVADSSPGMATGQAIDQSGGYWYVIGRAGEIIKKKP